MKKCKFCAEEIQDEAIKCKYCGSELKEDKTTKNISPDVHHNNLLQNDWKTSPLVFVWILVLATIIIIAFGFWGTVGVGVITCAVWWLWKKSKFDKKKKIIFTSVVMAIFILICASNLYANRAPSIKIISPENKTSIQAENILIKGKVSPPESELTINGKVIKIESGLFSYDYSLDDKIENNSISFKARANGKETNTSLIITRIFTDEEKLAIEKAKAEAKLKAQKAEEARIAKEKAELEAYYRTPAGRLCKQHPSWDKDECQLVAENKFWIGMNLEMLKAIRGLPDNANPSNYGSGTHWQWCWHDHTPSCFYGGDDGIITSYN